MEKVRTDSQKASYMVNILTINECIFSLIIKKSIQIQKFLAGLAVFAKKKKKKRKEKKNYSSLESLGNEKAIWSISKKDHSLQMQAP